MHVAWVNLHDMVALMSMACMMIQMVSCLVLVCSYVFLKFGVLMIMHDTRTGDLIW